MSFPILNYIICIFNKSDVVSFLLNDIYFKVKPWQEIFSLDCDIDLRTLTSIKKKKKYALKMHLQCSVYTL